LYQSQNKKIQKNENNRNNPKKSVTDKNAQIVSEPIGQQQTGKKQKLRA